MTFQNEKSSLKLSYLFLSLIMFPKRVWIAFVIIIIAFGLVMQEVEGLRYLMNKPQYIKHIIHFSSLIFFFAIGYWGWSSYNEKWILNIWIIIYSFSVIFFGILGLIDLLNRIENRDIRYIFFNIRLFFTSPVPYAVCMLLIKWQKRIR